jgi:hypothetical protein
LAWGYLLLVLLTWFLILIQIEQKVSCIICRRGTTTTYIVGLVESIFVLSVHRQSTELWSTMAPESASNILWIKALELAWDLPNTNLKILSTIMRYVLL